MSRFLKGLSLGLAILVCTGPAWGQSTSAERPTTAHLEAPYRTVETIARNGISVLHAEGDTLFIGPLLNVTDDGGATFYESSAFDLPNVTADDRLRIYSLDIEGDVIWAGLGYAVRDANDAVVNIAGGFVVSRDAGKTWQYLQAPLDVQTDTLIVYGQSTLRALPVVVAENSPPWDVDYDPVNDVTWTAAFASGIRRGVRTVDDGATTYDFERVVLPPDSLDYLSPDSSYHFLVSPVGSDGNEGLNYRAFAVLVDEVGTVWAGTADGLNRSTDAATRGAAATWHKFGIGGSGVDELPGDFVVSIEEQPLAGRNPVWIASRPTGQGQQFGITVTRDGGETFDTVYLGTPVFDFAFDGTTVYAAGAQEGLLISNDDGRTWRTVRDFRDPDQPGLRLPPTLEVFAVATTPGAVWLGTSGGLLKSEDDGATWRIFRAFVPTHPETPTERVPEVDVYAYPNPFSPSADTYARIRYDLEASAQIRIQVYDFGMNRVRTVLDGARGPGPQEEVWDGTSDDGLRVANGTYFYAVSIDGETFWGKILVLQ